MIEFTQHDSLFLLFTVHQRQMLNQVRNKSSLETDTWNISPSFLIFPLLSSCVTLPTSSVFSPSASSLTAQYPNLSLSSSVHCWTQAEVRFWILTGPNCFIGTHEVQQGVCPSDNLPVASDKHKDMIKPILLPPSCSLFFFQIRQKFANTGRFSARLQTQG